MNENTILKSVPAAGALRKVPGFDPLKYLRATTSAKTGEKVLKLDLPFKRLWFRLACPNGRMLLKPLRITDQMAIFEAKVFLNKDDPTPISNFTSTQMARSVPGGLYIRAAQDEALNEALDNAGFGIQLCDVIQVSDGGQFGSEIPLSEIEAAQKSGASAPVSEPAAVVEGDAQAQSVQRTETAPVQEPAPTAPPTSVVEQAAAPMAEPTPAIMEEPAVSAPEAHAATMEVNAPVMVSAEPDGPGTLTEEQAPEAEAQPVEAEPQQPTPQIQVVEPVADEPIAVPSDGEFEVTDTAAPAYTADMPVDEICQRMTLDEARAVVVELGNCKGWTLQEVCERRPASLKFYVRGCRDADNVLKAASSLLLSELEQQKLAS